MSGLDLVKTYCPEDITLMISLMGKGATPAEVGPTLFTEKIDGWESIKITYSNPTFRNIKGIRGTATRSRSWDRSKIVEVTLDQTSKSNLVLFTLLRFDNAGLVDSPFMLSFSDNTGKTTASDKQEWESITGYQFPESTSTTLTSYKAYIEGLPDVEFTDESTSRVWTFHCVDGAITVGRGASLRQGLLEAASGLLDSAISGVTSVVSKSLPSITKVFNK
jgi:hypothetical protein